MNKILLTIDLDNVVFDLSPIYKKAVYESGEKVDWKPSSYNIDKAYPEKTATILKRLLFEDYDLVAPGRVIEGDKLIQTINNLIQSPMYDVCFVTDRSLHLPTYEQLRMNGINVLKGNLYICNGNKLAVLESLLKDYHYHIHFDDLPEIIEGCNNVGIKGVLIRSPYTLYNHSMKTKFAYPTLLKALKSISF